MQIIPVLDIKDGVVVHAKQGNRAEYLSIQSSLCQSANPIDVIKAFRQQFNPQTVYIADLNAITRQGCNSDLLNTILRYFFDISFWIDSGFPLPDKDLQQLDNFTPVLGSESFTEESLSTLENFDNEFILSLDYSATGKLGAKALFYRTKLWPNRIIIMTLSKVGSSLGPDLETLQTYRNLYPQHTFIAAGGVRNHDDLDALSRIGIHHALLATALHNGQINPDDIMGKFQAKKYPV